MSVCLHNPPEVETHDVCGGRWMRIVTRHCAVCHITLSQTFADEGEPPADWLVDLHNPPVDPDDPDFDAPWKQKP